MYGKTIYFYPGIKSVVSGYSGGHVENPTYEQVCTNQTGHVEAVQIEYDPEITSFENILDVYLKHSTPQMMVVSSSIEVKVISQ